MFVGANEPVGPIEPDNAIEGVGEAEQSGQNRVRGECGQIQLITEDEDHEIGINLEQEYQRRTYEIHLMTTQTNNTHAQSGQAERDCVGAEPHTVSQPSKANSK